MTIRKRMLQVSKCGVKEHRISVDRLGSTLKRRDQTSISKQMLKARDKKIVHDGKK